MSKTASVSLVLLLSFVFTTKLNAQWLEEVQASSWFGFRQIECEVHTPGEHLDFMNYLRANTEDWEDEYLGVHYLLKIRGHMQLDIKMALNSGLYLDAYTFKIRHFPVPFMGWSLGVFSQPFDFRHYDEFLLNRDTEYFTDLRNSTNYSYMNVSDHGLMAGLVLPADYKFLHLTLQLNGGVSTFGSFEDVFGQKRKNSNYRRELHYESRSSYNWFFLPEAALSIDLLRIKDIRIGIQAQASWYVTNKYVDYELSTYEWTYDDPVSIHVDMPGHRLTKLEYDAGLIIRFQ